MFDKTFNDLENFFVSFVNPPQKIKVDILDFNDYLLLKANLAGVKKEEIDVSYVNDTLKIVVNSPDNEFNIDQYVKKEIKTSYLERSFNITDIEFEKSVANYIDGILHIQLPKKLVSGTKINIE